jgi:hypothetical protein
MRYARQRIAARLTGGLDLLIDFATLGEYGLEPVNEGGRRCERSGQTTGWEALAPARRGDCAIALAGPVTAA